MAINQYGQPVGEPLVGWQGAQRPVGKTLAGQSCRLEPLEPERDYEALYQAYAQIPDGRDWTYLPTERPENAPALLLHLQNMLNNPGLVNLVVVDTQAQRPVGSVAFMRIDQGNGVLEIGHVCWSPLMKRQTSATEAIFMMLRYAFDELGYRRCEWKCDSLNAPSRQAALRFGFLFEGRFRQAVVVKGRNRDTDWFAITADRWPAIRTAFTHWLAAENFTADGQQRQRLQAFMHIA
ncbi:MAG: GNAT family N-acetyltransferase [Gibbsiella quercinecans]|uniref:GNAT family N-acetyltransferase n=1 Tax=Gibbsiella quercinecans TaxID=929813 RepID=UPI003F36A114